MVVCLCVYVFMHVCVFVCVCLSLSVRMRSLLWLVVRRSIRLRGRRCGRWFWRSVSSRYVCRRMSGARVPLPAGVSVPMSRGRAGGRALMVEAGDGAGQRGSGPQSTPS
jgi:hypothetical protein